MKNYDIDIPLKEISGIGNHYAKLFAKKDCFTLEDLLYFYPKKHEDRSSILKIEDALKRSLEEEEFIATIICQCVDISPLTFKNRTIKKYTFFDGKATIVVAGFNPMQRFKRENYYILSGKVQLKYNEIQLALKEYEVFDDEAYNSIHTGRIVPLYPSTEGLTQKRIRNTLRKVLEELASLPLAYENIPLELIEKYQIKPKLYNIQKVHFPDDHKQLEECREQLVYEEFFNLQYTLAQNKKKSITGKEKNRYAEYSELEKLIQKLPYTLTKDQSTALKDILEDMSSSYTMNRLLQGDVGSGKTIVALLSMYFCYINKHQCVLLVPTDILARQHHHTFQKTLSPFGVNIVLLLGNQKEQEKKQALETIRSEKSLVVIGTHAVFQKKVEFFDLKYIVIDEQHRFGVKQRNALKEKGEKVDFCSMSATPIPRSLSMTIFGDTDISFIREKPKNRLEIQSKHLYDRERAHAYQFLLSRVKKEEQAYIVFPIISKNQNLELKSLEKEYAFLKKNVFKNIPITLLHGKLTAEEKKNIMTDFNEKKIKVLLGTTVLEVGIDNPNATVMIVESAEQFGFSQLHQLRGRVGRGNKSGYCYLISKNDIQEKTQWRLQQFVKTTDGFKIAEMDLETRGPGEILGERQSGLPPFRLADLIKDFEILKRARSDAQEVVFKEI